MHLNTKYAPVEIFLTIAFENKLPSWSLNYISASLLEKKMISPNNVYHEERKCNKYKGESVNVLFISKNRLYNV